MLMKTQPNEIVAPSKVLPLYGGYVGPNIAGDFQSPKTVQQVLSSTRMLNDMPIQLSGNITKQIGGVIYEFSDSTGSIYVEIEPDKWHGIQVSNETRVTIFGEIEYEYKPIIEVERIKAIN